MLRNVSHTRLHWSDADLLDILDKRGKGMQFRTIAETMSKRLGKQVSPASLIGLVSRINADTTTQIGPALDSSMPKHWWKTGLENRGERDAA